MFGITRMLIMIILLVSVTSTSNSAINKPAETNNKLLSETENENEQSLNNTSSTIETENVLDKSNSETETEDTSSTDTKYITKEYNGISFEIPDYYTEKETESGLNLYAETGSGTTFLQIADIPESSFEIWDDSFIEAYADGLKASCSDFNLSACEDKTYNNYKAKVASMNGTMADYGVALHGTISVIEIPNNGIFIFTIVQSDFATTDHLDEYEHMLDSVCESEIVLDKNTNMLSDDENIDDLDSLLTQYIDASDKFTATAETFTSGEYYNILGRYLSDEEKTAISLKWELLVAQGVSYIGTRKNYDLAKKEAEYGKDSPEYHAYSEEVDKKEEDILDRLLTYSEDTYWPSLENAFQDNTITSDEYIEILDEVVTIASITTEILKL